MILWMVGLVVLSLIGHYGGGLDIMGFIWGELITVIFSVVVFYVGISSNTGCTCYFVQLRIAPSWTFQFLPALPLVEKAAALQELI